MAPTIDPFLMVKAFSAGADTRAQADQSNRLNMQADYLYGSQARELRQEELVSQRIINDSNRLAHQINLEEEEKVTRALREGRAIRAQKTLAEDQRMMEYMQTPDMQLKVGNLIKKRAEVDIANQLVGLDKQSVEASKALVDAEKMLTDSTLQNLESQRKSAMYTAQAKVSNNLVSLDALDKENRRGGKRSYELLNYTTNMIRNGSNLQDFQDSATLFLPYLEQLSADSSIPIEQRELAADHLNTINARQATAQVSNILNSTISVGGGTSGVGVQSASSQVNPLMQSIKRNVGIAGAVTPEIIESLSVVKDDQAGTYTISTTLPGGSDTVIPMSSLQNAPEISDLIAGITARSVSANNADARKAVADRAIQKLAEDTEKYRNRPLTNTVITAMHAASNQSPMHREVYGNLIAAYEEDLDRVSPDASYDVENIKPFSEMLDNYLHDEDLLRGNYPAQRRLLIYANNMSRGGLTRDELLYRRNNYIKGLVARDPNRYKGENGATLRERDILQFDSLYRIPVVPKDVRDKVNKLARKLDPGFMPESMLSRQPKGMLTRAIKDIFKPVSTVSSYPLGMLTGAIDRIANYNDNDMSIEDFASLTSGG